MSREELLYFIGNNNVLNNIGAARSRSRSENIRSEYLSGGRLEQDFGTLCLLMPEDPGESPEKILLELAQRHLGLESWDKIFKVLPLPKKKMLVSPLNPALAKPDTDALDILRTAVILARCNPVYYLPEGPAIFTRARLSRCLRLCEIDTEAFYELD